MGRCNVARQSTPVSLDAVDGTIQPTDNSWESSGPEPALSVVEMKPPPSG